jgi:cell division protein FtsQ
MPLRQRRDELLRLQWVKDARVTRVWPNRLQIRITEREPVAFVQLPGEVELPLIDTDGHLLRPETQQTLNLPILTGITRQQNDEERRVRVRRLQKLVADAGELAAKISEVDASDPDNLKVMQDAGGKAVTLIVGNRSFKRRLEKFRQNAEDLLRRDPDKTVFDLRVDGSIYARPTLTAEGMHPVE